MIKTVLANIPPGAVITLPVTISFFNLGKTFKSPLSSNNSSSLDSDCIFKDLSLLSSFFSFIFSCLNELVDFTSSKITAISLIGLLTT